MSYLFHDTYTPLVIKGLQLVPYRKVRNTMIECWPRKQVASEYTTVVEYWGEYSSTPRRTVAVPVPGSEVEVFDWRSYIWHRGLTIEECVADECKTRINEAFGSSNADMFGSENSGDLVYPESVTSMPEGYDKEVAKVKYIHTFRQSEDYKSGQDLGKLESLWWELNATKVATISYRDIADYINERSELMDAAKVIAINKAKARKDRVLDWINSTPYPYANPPTYISTPATYDENGDELTPDIYTAGYENDPDFPLTSVDVAESLRLAELEEWEEFLVTYDDSYNHYLRNYEDGSAPLPINEDGALALINSGIFASTVSKDKWTTDDSNMNNSEEWFVNGTNTGNNFASTTYGLIYLGHGSWFNDTLRVHNYNPDSCGWAAIVGMNNSGFYPDDSYDFEGNYTGSMYPAVFNVDVEVITSTIERVSSPIRYMDEDGYGMLVDRYYTPYTRSITFKFKYKRVLDAHGLEGDSYSGEDGPEYNSRKAGATYAASRILTDYARGSSSLDTVIRQAIVDIKGKSAIEDVPGLVVIVPKTSSETLLDSLGYGHPSYSFLNVEKVIAMDIKLFVDFLMQGISVDYEKKHTSSWESFGNFIFSAAVYFASIWVLAVASFFTGPTGVMIAAQILRVGITQLQKEAETHGNYALADDLGQVTVMIGYASAIISMSQSVQSIYDNSAEFTKVTTSTVVSAVSLVAKTGILGTEANLVAQLVTVDASSLTNVASGSFLDVVKATGVVANMASTGQQLYYAMNPLDNAKVIPDEWLKDEGKSAYNEFGTDMKYIEGQFENPYETHIPLVNSFKMLSPNHLCGFAGQRFDTSIYS